MTEPLTGTLAPEFAARLPLIEGVALYGPESQTAEQQARIAEFDAPYGPLQLPDCEVTDAVVPGPHGPIPVRTYTGSRQAPPAEAGPALVWLHGGAFLGGDLDMPEADHTARFIAGTTGRPVISVAYRLAREGVHHPIPEDEVVAAYEWVRDGGTGLPIDPKRIAIGGASAGACLTASAGLRLRDIGSPPWQLFLVYPVAHSDVPAPDAELAVRLAQLPASLQPSDAAREFINTNYIGGPVADAGPYAFPGDDHDLTGLPSTYIENCEFDDLRASGELFGRQLAAAGVDVEVVCAPGVPHAHLNWQGSPRAYETLRHLCRRLTQD